jgi:serine/threonine-protein kinase
MALAPGTRLGVYSVTAQIGAGGMGEVYRATDTTLNRDVALKVLPDAFASDAERLARFQREAEVLASLNHPNIAAIHGLEEGDGTRALVLELVEGPTLADRIKQGPIPLEEAVAIAKQIAEALEAAHEAGVIHRDLKPANVKVKDDGTVKVLDFGLAKALEGDTGSDPSESPTLTAAATQMGVIMGTAAYMSPEQAAGRTADKRSDIWSFGVVLFEMLSGQRLFTGETVSHVLGAVLQVEPKWDALPATTPEPLRKLLRRCLEKERKRRLRDIGDALTDLDEALTAQPTDERAVTPVTQPAAWRQALPWVAGIAVGGVITGLAVWSLAPTLTSPVSRFGIPISGLSVGAGLNTPLALSPDGRTLVAVANDGQTRQLYQRPLDELDQIPIRGTEGAEGPIFSPDGEWVAFWTIPPEQILKKVALAGGPPTTLTPVSDFRWADWGPDGTIVFAGADTVNTGLWLVAESGGEPQQIATPEEEGERYVDPQFTPDGGAVLFTIIMDAGPQVAVRSLETGEQKVLLAGTSARLTPTGHLLFMREDSLWAVPFDTDGLELAGEESPVLEDVQANSDQIGRFALGDDGSLVYVPSDAVGGAAVRRTLVWVDRQGTEESVAAEPLPYEGLDLSPDGLRVATEVRDLSNLDIYIYDLARETPTRFTLDPGVDTDPIWTPDGNRLVWSSGRGGGVNVWWKAADGTGEAEQLTNDVDNQGVSSLSPDGETLVFWQVRPSGADVGILSLDDPQSTSWLFENPFRFGHSEISPDGRWIAYTSDEEGQDEVYVRPFPNVEDGRAKVSQDGGFVPRWGPNSDELFFQAYQGADRESGTVTMMMAPIETEPRLRAGNPVALFTGPYRAGELVQNVPRPYDVSGDGQRFLIIKETAGADEAVENDIILVQNFDEELKRLFPDQ